MLRRRFIGALTVLGAGSLAAIGKVETGKAAHDGSTETHAGERTVTYAVDGFTCITCAVGLETLIRQEKGVVSASASYPAATATIRFVPTVITEEALRSFIQDKGFVAHELTNA